MTYSFWLEQSISVSHWLDASARIGATSLDRSPGVYTRGGPAGPARSTAKGERIIVILDRFSTT
jgi:hypothetical protein